MVIYSILPPETIFGQEPSGSVTHEYALDRRGARILARLQDGMVIIERVSSTDPRHFLDPQCQPGAAVPPLPPAPPLWG